MEYVEGGELFDRIKDEQRLSEQTAKFYLSQIILLISYLHSQNIVYRDLKPENLLIDSDGYLKLVDFGFAKRITNSLRTYTLCGTPEYLSPELLEGVKNGYGNSVDWWSIGILFYEMVFGYPPFIDNDTMKMYKKIIENNVKFPENIGWEAKDLIQKLLKKNVEKRIGCSDNGESIKQHVFFHSFSFDRVLQKQMASPWIPKEHVKVKQNFLHQRNELNNQIVTFQYK